MFKNTKPEVFYWSYHIFQHIPHLPIYYWNYTNTENSNNFQCSKLTVNRLVLESLRIQNLKSFWSHHIFQHIPHLSIYYWNYTSIQNFNNFQCNKLTDHKLVVECFRIQNLVIFWSHHIFQHITGTDYTTGLEWFERILQSLLHVQTVGMADTDVARVVLVMLPSYECGEWWMWVIQYGGFPYSRSSYVPFGAFWKQWEADLRVDKCGIVKSTVPCGCSDWVIQFGGFP